MRARKLRAIYLIMDNFRKYSRRKFVFQLRDSYRWETSQPPPPPSRSTLNRTTLHNLLQCTRSTKELSRNSFKGVRVFQVELEFGSVRFCGGRKTGQRGEKPSEQGRELTTNSTHIWRRVRESNPGHIGGRRVLSPLRPPCSRRLRERFGKRFYPRFQKDFNYFVWKLA